MLKNEYSLATIGVDTTENELRKECCVMNFHVDLGSFLLKFVVDSMFGLASSQDEPLGVGLCPWSPYGVPAPLKARVIPPHITLSGARFRLYQRGS